LKISQNAGETWQNVEFDEKVKLNILTKEKGLVGSYETYVSHDGQVLMFAASVRKEENSDPAALLLSLDGGKTWNTKDIPDFHEFGGYIHDTQTLVLGTIGLDVLAKETKYRWNISEDQGETWNTVFYPFLPFACDYYVGDIDATSFPSYLVEKTGTLMVGWSGWASNTRQTGISCPLLKVQKQM